MDLFSLFRGKPRPPSAWSQAVASYRAGSLPLADLLTALELEPHCTLVDSAVGVPAVAMHPNSPGAFLTVFTDPAHADHPDWLAPMRFELPALFFQAAMRNAGLAIASEHPRDLIFIPPQEIHALVRRLESDDVPAGDDRTDALRRVRDRACSLELPPGWKRINPAFLNRTSGRPPLLVASLRDPSDTVHSHLAISFPRLAPPEPDTPPLAMLQETVVFKFGPDHPACSEHPGPPAWLSVDFPAPTDVTRYWFVHHPDHTITFASVSVTLPLLEELMPEADAIVRSIRLGPGHALEPQPGALYSVRESPETFGLAKVLVVDDRAVHVRLERRNLQNRPAAWLPPDPARLDGASFIVLGHTPLSEARFWDHEPVLIGTEPVLEEELDGYRIWQSAEGGVFP